MEDKRETVFDTTYLQPGIIARSGAIALAALGIGAGVLLACWGASLFFTDNKRHDVLMTKVEQLVQRPDRTDEVVAKLDSLVQRPDRTDEVVTKLDNLDRNASKIGSNITSHVTSVEGSLEELKHRPIISGNPDNHATNGSVIEREVMVFHHVPHDDGSDVETGWAYSNGASADQPPKKQFCHWRSGSLGGTTAQAVVELANDGKRLQNIGAGVPHLEDALQKCVWWNATTN